MGRRLKRVLWAHSALMCLANPIFAKPLLLPDVELRSFGIVHMPESQCTATRVSEVHLVTAAHCVSQFEKSSEKYQIHSDSFESAASVVIRGTQEFDKFVSQDWAVLKTEKSLPVAVRIQTLLRDASLTPVDDKVVFLAAFWQPILDLFELGGVDEGCSIHRRYRQIGDIAEVFIHNCEGSWGASGAPLFANIDGEIVIVGIHARYGLPTRATWDPDRKIETNMAVPVANFLNELELLF